VLVGRSDEAAILGGLLARARDGSSSALIVHGDPGVGKTALLDSVLGSPDHLMVVRTQPFQTESELPFAALSDLLHPFYGLLDRIPERQAAVLSGALALGPPAPGDRFAAAAATLSLLAAAAEEAPVVVAVDDAHWLDAASREALLFAGRRLGSEGIVLLLAMRHRDWIEQAGIDTMQLIGLAPEAAASLLDRTGRRVAPHVRDRIVAETGGNPLAMLEAAASLSDAQLDGSQPLDGPVPVGPMLEQALAERIGPLPEPTRRALLVVAASETGDADEIGRAIGGLGITVEALVAAEKEGLIATEAGRIEFRHPLIRSAAYHALGPDVRRAAHRALAEALEPDQADRIAWHLAAASAGPDERVALLLEASGTRALAQGGYAAAGRALETAARLSPSDDVRLRRTMDAGRALWLGGEGERASALLEGVLDLAVEPTIRADLKQLRAAVTVFTRPVAETFAMLVAEAERVEPHDSTRAGALLGLAAATQLMAADVVQAAETVRRALEILRIEEGPVAMQARIVAGQVHVVYGEVDEALAVLIPLADALLSIDPLRQDPLTLGGTVQSLRAIEQSDRADAILERLVGAARAAGAPSMLPYPLAVLAEGELQRGRVAAAYAAATESVQLATETGQGGSSISFIMLGRVEAILGHDQACREHVAAGLDSARKMGAGSIEMFAASALGLLELSLGHADRAVLHLAECRRLEESVDVRNPMIHQGAADLVEACIRAGSLEAAERHLAVLECQAAQAGLRWPVAMATRCRGLLADDAAYEGEFQASLDLLGSDMPFERARTLLCLGMRRRRSRRRADARAAIHDALTFFEAAGAEPWAEQARVELRAAGEAPAPARSGTIRELTAQELQVALVVADGATNKEAAAALFLSPKTIEFHLGNVYRKLGVRSRTELVRRVAWNP
jgi:DNA-binding CsgD family transcriptional regulator